MVSIEIQSQQWANIKPGERFVRENDTVVVKHKSQVTFWQRITGKARLGHALEAIIDKVEKEREALQASTDYAVKANLRTLKERVQKITDDYYASHWKIYIWLFGNDAKSKCKTLLEKVDGILEGMTSDVLSSDTPMVSEAIDDSVFITINTPTTPQAVQRSEETLTEVATWLTDHVGQARTNEYSRKERKFRELATANPPPENLRINLRVFREAGGYTHFFSGASDEIKNKWVAHLFNNASDIALDHLKDFAIHTLEDLIPRDNVSGKKEALEAILAFATRNTGRDFVRLCDSIAGIGGGVSHLIAERVSGDSLCKFLRLFICQDTDLSWESRNQAEQMLAQHVPVILQHHELVSQLLDLESASRRHSSYAFNSQYIIPAVLADRQQAERYLDIILDRTPSEFSPMQSTITAIFRNPNEEVLALLFEKARERGHYDAARRNALSILEAEASDEYTELFLKVVDLSDCDLDRTIPDFSLVLKLAIAGKRLGDSVSANYDVIKRQLWERVPIRGSGRGGYDAMLADYLKEDPTAWGRWCTRRYTYEFSTMITRLSEQEVLNKVTEFMNVPERSLATTFKVWFTVCGFNQNRKLIETLDDDKLNTLISDEQYHDLGGMWELAKLVDPSNEKQKQFLRGVVQIPGAAKIENLNPTQYQAIEDLIDDSAQAWFKLRQASLEECLEEISSLQSQEDCTNFLTAKYPNTEEQFIDILEYQEKLKEAIANPGLHDITPFLNTWLDLLDNDSVDTHCAHVLSALSQEQMNTVFAGRSDTYAKHIAYTMLYDAEEEKLKTLIDIFGLDFLQDTVFQKAPGRRARQKAEQLEADLKQATTAEAAKQLVDDYLS